MKKTYPYLNDFIFLNELFHFKTITYFTNIILLDWNENEIESIEGKVINASFNVDGNSSVRRTGNLTFMLDSTNNTYAIQSLFPINRKLFIQIGLKNTTNKYLNEYPIVWFPIGLFILNGINIQKSNTSLTIQLQMQDKMCLLNGECGGTIPASTVFDNYETIDNNGNIIIKKTPIYQIIMQLVNHFGQQDLSKILIADLDSRVKQVMKWTGNTPLYVVYKGSQYQMTTSSSTYIALKKDHWLDASGNPFEYGRDVGYIYTDFTYPGELISNAGDSVTDILDKVISILGNYEYFYDIYGNFIFQEIKNFLNNSQAKLVINKLNNTKGNLQIEDYILDMSRGKSVYTFENADLITAYNNTPQYSAIKNDFIIWGFRKNNNIQSPIRYHLAIDKKPEVGNTYEVFKYIDPNDGLEKWNQPLFFTNKSHFPSRGAEGVFYCDKSNKKIYKWGKDSNYNNTYILTDAVLERVTTKDWRTELYFQGVVAQTLGTHTNEYYAELKNEWPKIYNIKPDVLQNGTYINNSDFKPEIFNDITQLNYFLDFIDTDSKIMQLAINNIGKRTIVLNDNSVNCVFEPNIPDIILIKTNGDIIIDSQGEAISETDILRQECEQRNQNYYQVPDNIYDSLTLGGSFYSGYQVVRQMLHQYTSYNESISISCLPLYFLEPNTRISIFDDDTNIFGDYILTNYNFNIDSSSVMNFNAIKALEKK